MPSFAPGYGMRICTRRRQLGMTQIQLANAAGCGQIAVSHWENEKTTPQAESWFKLATALQTNEHWLRHGTEAPALILTSADLSGVSLAMLINELARRGFAVIAANTGPFVDVSKGDQSSRQG